MRIVVIGGGIAGLAAAWALSREHRDVTLVERDEQLATHSSAKNAAIYRPLEGHVPVAWLARRNAELLDALLGSREAWLRERGLLLVAKDRAPLASLVAIARELQLEHRELDADAIVALAPACSGGHARHGLHAPRGGVLDVHAITSALAGGLRARGGRIELRASVDHVEARAGRVHAVRMADGTSFAADLAVLTGGAWAGGLGAASGVPLPLTPVRRHLALLEPEPPIDRDAPTVWDVGIEAYLRPESGGVLASPGDATPWPAGDPAPDPAALELLFQKLGQLAPSLTSSRVRTSWACLRTFAPDGVTVVGADPRMDGLYWSAGLGGHGITTAAAVGEALAEAVAGREHPHARALSPARLLGRSP